jgi:hypothetical protein
MAMLHKLRRTHRLPALVDVLQISSDGNESLYQVQVNRVPWYEMHMIAGSVSAQVELRKYGHMLTIDTVEFFLDDGWLPRARMQVARMLQNRHPNAIVSWYTRGAQTDD